MKNLVNLFEEKEWEEAIDYPEGTKMKTLRDNAEGRTILLKLAAGFKLGSHSHVVAEQHLVLKGSYTSDGRTFPAGSFQIYSPHEEHGPFESEEGALILVIWDALQ
ncbi:MAG: cupin domain-containing protein [Bacteroidales bacterium]|nr:cupin domain-containing protein [Bacteroidales bacterium]